MTALSPSQSVDKTLPEAVAAVYRFVTFGVIAAWLASLVLVVTLGRAGYVAPLRGTLFTLAIGACATLHIALARSYRHSTTNISAAQRWGRAFAIVSLLEGIVWGLAPVGLVSSDNFGAQLLCLSVTLGIATGAVAAFSAYLPTFFALFVPAVLPFAVSMAAHTEPLQQSAALLTAIYILAIGAFGIFLNRSFRNLVALRLHAESLASDLGEQIKIAEAANRAKSSFLAAASHDLRQPVHALGLFIGALRGMPMSSQAMTILEQIESSSQALDDLFAALLDISRLDAGTVDVHPLVFCIGPMLERICGEHAREADEKRIQLNVHPCSSYVRSDPILIERILRNLVSNAVRYTQTGRVVVGCRRRGPALIVEVIDTGEGIAAAQQSRIFEEYYQVGNTERDRSKGLGLGLAIVRRLTNLLDCKLTLVSRPGHGSRFSIAIAHADPTAIVVQDRTREAVPPPLAGRMIVVVDDEADIRAAMSTVLRRWGHEVIVAGSQSEAIANLADCPVRPDLIISDLRLRQEESGIDVIEALRLEYNAKIPAILITGDTAPGRLLEASRSGLLLMHKPVSNSRLRAAIANAMASVADQNVVMGPSSAR